MFVNTCMPDNNYFICCIKTEREKKNKDEDYEEYRKKRNKVNI